MACNSILKSCRYFLNKSRITRPLDQKIGGLLSFARSRDNRPLMRLQNLEPRIDVLGVMGVRYRAEPQVGAGERSSEFRD